MTDWDSSMRQMSAVEAFVTRAASRIDSAVAAIVRHQRWPLLVGILAVALSLIADTPDRSLFRDVGKQWYSDVLLRQIEHPLSPIDYETYREIDAASGLGILTHVDKTAFRISIPLFGKIFHTGAASILIMNYVAGFLFFPMLVVVANRIFGDPIVAVYITFAFALTWTGAHFFNDSFYGDGFAYFWLLASIYFNRTGLVFASVLIAAFTDERALIGSAAAVFYFLGRAREVTRQDNTALVAISSVVAAWIAYFAIRGYMIFGLGFRTSIMTNNLHPQIVWFNIALGIPYAALTVFQGLWIWLPIGLLALWLRRSIFETLGFAGLTVLMLAVALAVWDFQRSLGYMLLLLPVAWQSAALSERANRSISRSCFVLGLTLITPFNTVLRYLYAGPILTPPFYQFEPAH
jgi:hypothetical protein